MENCKCIETLQALREKIENEQWHGAERREAALLGIDISITKLKHSKAN
jgi:hypothetical protein